MSWRICPICSTGFEAVSRRKYCSRPCKQVANAEESRRYRETHTEEINSRARTKYARERRGMVIEFPDEFRADQDEARPRDFGPPRQPDRRPPGVKSYDRERGRSEPSVELPHSFTVMFPPIQTDDGPFHGRRAPRGHRRPVSNWVVLGVGAVRSSVPSELPTNRFGPAVSPAHSLFEGHYASNMTGLAEREAVQTEQVRRASENLRTQIWFGR